MGVPPAYEDVVNNHPVNQFAPSRSTSAYAGIPQDDDVELNAHTHDHHESVASTSATPPDSLVQTLAGVFKPKSHEHCEQCDIQTTARQRNEKYCCTMVAATFMALFVCLMLLGIVIVISGEHKKRNRHD